MLKSVRCLFLLATLFFYVGIAKAQPPQFNWESIGPANLGGSVRALAYSPDGNRLYAGAPGGGLWVSVNDGNTWAPVESFNKNVDVASLAITSIAFDAITGKMYVATGAAFQNSDHLFVGQVPYSELNNARKGYLGYAGLFGSGMFVSSDNGSSFSFGAATVPTNATSTADVFTSINVVKAHNGKVYIGTQKGLYESTDDGSSVSLVNESYASPPSPSLRLAQAPIYDIEISSNGTVFVGSNRYLFISRDGDTFDEYVASSDLPVGTSSVASNIDRVEVAIAPNDANTVYLTMATFDIQGVWKSTDNAQNWTNIAPATTATLGGSSIGAFAPCSEISTISGGVIGKCPYALVLAVDPQNKDRIMLGSNKWFEYTAETGWVSETRSFSLTLGDNRYVPNYITTFVFKPGTQTLLLGTDKEVVRSTDAGKRFQIATGNLTVAQVYDVAVGADGVILASTRGHGNIRLASTTSKNWDALEPIIPRRGSVAVSKYNSEFMVSGSNNTFHRSLNSGYVFTNSDWVPFPTSDAVYFDDKAESLILNQDLVPPISPIVLDEVDTTALHIARDSKDSIVNKQYVFLGAAGQVWLARFPFNPTDDLNKPTMLSIFRDNDGTNEPSAMTISDDETHTLFIGTTDGKVYRIKNAHMPNGGSLPFESTLILDPATDGTPDRWVTGLRLHPTNKDTLIVTYGTYRNENPTLPGCQRCGFVWATNQAMSSNNPTFYNQHDHFSELGWVPVYDAIFNPDDGNNNKWLAIGTERGVYTINESELNFSNTTTANGVNWAESNSGDMSKVPVYRFAYNGTKLVTANYPAPDDDKTYTKLIVDNERQQLYIATWGRGVMRSNLLAATSRNDGKAQKTNLYQLKVYPNPATSRANLELNMYAPGTVSLEVFDMKGSRVQQQHYGQLPSGVTKREVSVEGLVPGTYLFKTTVAVAGKLYYATQRIVVN